MDCKKRRAPKSPKENKEELLEGPAMHVVPYDLPGVFLFCFDLFI